MEQPAALCGFSFWLAPLGFPRGEAVSHDGTSEPARLTDEGWRELKNSEIPVEWCKTKTNTIHPAAFMNKPVAAPHQAFLPIGSEVPLVKKSSFPPGEAKRRLRELVPFNVPLCSGNGRLLRVPIIYKLFTHAIVVGVNVSPLTSQRMENMEKSLALGVFSTFFCGKRGK